MNPRVFGVDLWYSIKSYYIHSHIHVMCVNRCCLFAHVTHRQVSMHQIVCKFLNESTKWNLHEQHGLNTWKESMAPPTTVVFNATCAVACVWETLLRRNKYILGLEIGLACNRRIQEALLKALVARLLTCIICFGRIWWRSAAVDWILGTNTVGPRVRLGVNW